MLQNIADQVIKSHYYRKIKSPAYQWIKDWRAGKIDDKQLKEKCEVLMVERGYIHHLAFGWRHPDQLRAMGVDPNGWGVPCTYKVIEEGSEMKWITDRVGNRKKKLVPKLVKELIVTDQLNNWLAQQKAKRFEEDAIDHLII